MSTLEFEIKGKDIAARIGKLKIGKKEIETPTLMPVFNFKKPLISISELKKEFGVGSLMTNAYLLLREEVVVKKVKKQGIHSFLNFPGIIATDSGSYQLMRYGSLNTTNQEVVEFEEKIKTDIGSFLDIPTLPDAYKPRAMEDLKKTLERAKEAKKAKIVINAGIQGSTFLDLRKKSAKEIGKNFQLCAIGGLVRLAENYRFSELIDIIATCKKNLPTNRVVHGFGLGHPIFFSLAVALGVDLFDSAAYALYAQNDRYLTVEGTKKVKELNYLPCNCPICQKYDAEELRNLDEEKRVKGLAKHNLHITFAEIKKIKQAIAEESLWELLQMRARAHPNLLAGLKRVGKHKNFLASLDKITKKQGFYYLGSEAKGRTEVVNAKRRLKRVNSTNLINAVPFGKIPLEVSDVYPFNSLELKNRYISDIEKVKSILDYQFGSDASKLIPKNLRIKKSRKTGRIRWIHEGRELIAVVRARDHLIIPKEKLLKRLHEKFKFPKLRVVIHEEAIPFVSEGKSVFAKFVLKIDPELRAGDEVLVVDKKDNLIRGGTLILSPKEVMDFQRGMAVRVR